MGLVFLELLVIGIPLGNRIHCPMVRFDVVAEYRQR